MIDLPKWVLSIQCLHLKNNRCFTSIRTVAPETDFQIALFHTSHFHVSSKMRFLWRSHFQKIHPPKKLPPLLGSFWVKTPWRVGLTVWVSHGCPSTYPTFFGGPHLRNRLRTQKETETKKPLTTLQIHLGVSPTSPKKNSSIANWTTVGSPCYVPLNLKFAGTVACQEMTWLRQ